MGNLSYFLKMMKLKATKIKDSNTLLVKFPRGVFEIDGKEYSFDGFEKKNIQISNPPKVKRKKHTRPIVGFITPEEEKITTEEYYSKERDLLKNARLDEDEEYYIFNSIEEEAAYLHFTKKQYRKIREDKYSYEDCEFDILEGFVLFDTGNKHIKSSFSIGLGKEDVYYVYDRPSALIDIVRECFNDLGMSSLGDCIDFGGTNQKKVWGNATHSGIRYVTAFNGYVFSDKWECKYSSRGTLESMIAEYNKDVEEINDIIRKKYKLHFESRDYKKSYELIEQALEKIEGLDVKIRHKDEHKIIKNLMRKALSEFK